MEREGKARLITDVDLVHGHVKRVGEALLGACAGLVLGLEMGFEDVVLLLCKAGLHVCAASVLLCRRSPRWLPRSSRLLRLLRRGAIAVARERRHVIAKAVHPKVLFCAPREGGRDRGVLRCGFGLEG
jgi:hypothetical protein